MRQKTLKNDISFSGTGLHSGLHAHVKLRPAREDHGILFIRTDLKKPVSIRAEARNVTDTQFATTIGHNGASVATIEHLMAALYGMGIDNAVVEIDSSEVPILDGSASHYVDLIKEAGVSIQQRAKRYLVIKKPLKVMEKDKLAMLLPSNDLKISYSIDFAHPIFDEQVFSGLFSEKVFVEEISRARTFGFLKDVELLRANGFAKGGSLENAVVIGDDAILNDEGLRYPDELVRHKVLDIMGDLALLGMPVVGHLVADRSGHTLNHSLVMKVLRHHRRWEISESDGTPDGRRPYHLRPLYAANTAPF
ncbi:MAG: UDP-3-O-acyl-N-acetylglucosamine deacetylase [Thermodesulfobacteriota bacterium]